MKQLETELWTVICSHLHTRVGLDRHRRAIVILEFRDTVEHVNPVRSNYEFYKRSIEVR